MPHLGTSRAIFVKMLLMLGSVVQVNAQSADPFVMPPPGRAPQAPGTPPMPSRPTVTIEMLASQGFEVKAVERSAGAGAGYLVLLQRAGEIRTCLMRLSFDASRNPGRDSFCF